MEHLVGGLRRGWSGDGAWLPWSRPPAGRGSHPPSAGPGARGGQKRHHCARPEFPSLLLQHLDQLSVCPSCHPQDIPEATVPSLLLPQSLLEPAVWRGNGEGPVVWYLDEEVSGCFCSLGSQASRPCPHPLTCPPPEEQSPSLLALSPRASRGAWELRAEQSPAEGRPQDGGGPACWALSRAAWTQAGHPSSRPQRPRLW